jgi:phage terminase large subunit-like protein
LLSLVLSKKLRHGANPVLGWMAGNIKPAKPDRGKSGKRIDGMVALIMAIDRANRNENQASAWSGPGFILI